MNYTIKSMHLYFFFRASHVQSKEFENEKRFSYADDVLLIAESENNLQRFVYKFANIAMEICTENSKMLVVSKIQCKLLVENKSIEEI